MPSFKKKILVVVVYLIVLAIAWYIMTKNCSSKEHFKIPQKYSGALLKNIPEVLERSKHYPTIEGFGDMITSMVSDEPKKSYGTMLKNVPQVSAISKKFATARSGKFKGTDDIVLPINFDGRVVWKDYLTPVTEQGTCGNCWSHATTSALADRFAIFSIGKIKFVPSPYEITVCAHKFTDIKNQWGNTGALELMDDYLHGRKVDPTQALQSAACEGASLFTAAEVLYTDGVPSLECFPSKGTVSTNSYNISTTPAGNPTSLPYCHTLETMAFDTCVDQKSAAKKYRARTAYNVGDPTKDNLDELEHAIKYEIYKRGPLATGFMVFGDFMDSYDGKTVYTHMDKSSGTNGGHAVKIVGWGDDGVDSLGNTEVPYWIIQNSWGTDWGESGFFKFKRKIPECQLEQNAMGMLPDFPGMEINDPNIIPIETSTDIEGIKAFKDHYLDPYTGFYLSGIEKIRTCKLTGNVVPYIDPTIPLPDYSTFYAGQISEYLAKNPIPSTAPLVASVVCNSVSTTTGIVPAIGETVEIVPTPPVNPEVIVNSSDTKMSIATKVYDYITTNKYILAAVIILLVIGSSTVLWKILDLFDDTPLTYIAPSDQTFNGYIGQSYL